MKPSIEVAFNHKTACKNSGAARSGDKRPTIRPHDPKGDMPHNASAEQPNATPTTSYDPASFREGSTQHKTIIHAAIPSACHEDQRRLETTTTMLTTTHMRTHTTEMRHKSSDQDAIPMSLGDSRFCPSSQSRGANAQSSSTINNAVLKTHAPPRLRLGPKWVR